jgi:DNA repair protein RecO
MAYVTYTTQALVCGTFRRNTSDSSYLLFTREAGMLYADARSVREEKSRQRYALQDFSLVKVSLIKGKRSWKIGSIQSIKNYYAEAEDKQARGSVVSMFRFLRRFLKGEEIMSDIYDSVVLFLEELTKDIDHRTFIDDVFQLKVLAKLGYVDDKKIPKEIVDMNLDTFTSIVNPELEQTVRNLHVQAVAVSHL